MAESLAELAAMFDTPRPPAKPSAQPPATMPTTYDWDSVISEEAKKYPNVPEPVVRALIARESGGNPMADIDTQTQWGKARGLGQFIDETAKRYVPDWQDPSDSYDPVKNIKGIYAYLDDLTKQTGSVKRALVRYHGGGTDVLGTNSLDYARQILVEAENGGKRFTVQPEESLDELAAMFTNTQEGAGITTEQPADEQKPKKDPVWTVAGGTFPDPKKLINHYVSGIKEIVDKPLETLFPMATKGPSEGKTGVIQKLKDNALALLDVVSWLDRGINYAAGGVIEEGQEALKEAIPEPQGEGFLPATGRLVSGLAKTGAEIATSPSTYVGVGTIKKAMTPAAQLQQKAMEKTVLGGLPKSGKVGTAVKRRISEITQLDKDILDEVAKNPKYLNHLKKKGISAGEGGVDELLNAIQADLKSINIGTRTAASNAIKNINSNLDNSIKNIVSKADENAKVIAGIGEQKIAQKTESAIAGVKKAIGATGNPPLVVVWDDATGDIIKTVPRTGKINTHRAGLDMLTEAERQAVIDGKMGIGFFDDRGWVVQAGQKKADVAKANIDKLMASAEDIKPPSVIGQSIEDVVQRAKKTVGERFGAGQKNYLGEASQEFPLVINEKTGFNNIQSQIYSALDDAGYDFKKFRGVEKFDNVPALPADINDATNFMDLAGEAKNTSDLLNQLRLIRKLKGARKTDGSFYNSAMLAKIDKGYQGAIEEQLSQYAKTIDGGDDLVELWRLNNKRYSQAVDALESISDGLSINKINSEAYAGKIKDIGVEGLTKIKSLAAKDDAIALVWDEISRGFTDNMIAKSINSNGVLDVKKLNKLWSSIDNVDPQLKQILLGTEKTNKINNALKSYSNTVIENDVSKKALDELMSNIQKSTSSAIKGKSAVAGEKIKTISKISKASDVGQELLGTPAYTRLVNVGNNTPQNKKALETLRVLDEFNGTDYAEKAMDFWKAKHLRITKEGVLPWVTDVRTGRSLLGPVLGQVVGDIPIIGKPAGVVMGVAGQSPAGAIAAYRYLDMIARLKYTMTVRPTSTAIAGGLMGVQAGKQ